MTLNILRSRIPHGGFGRRLTSTEIRAIKKAYPGTPIGSAPIVVQNGADYRGRVYRYQRPGSYSSTDIVVGTID
jgi:hypothetical protein